MNPYQPGEDNQDPYEVGYKAGAASRAEQIASLKDELRQISTAIDDVRLDLTNTSAELIMEMKERLASRDAEVVSLTNQRDYEYVRAENAEHDRLCDVIEKAGTTSEIALRIKTEEHQCCTEDLLEVRRSEQEGWKEAAIAWEVCASIHEKWAKKKDALYSTRHADFEKHAEHARQKLAPND